MIEHSRIKNFNHITKNDFSSETNFFFFFKIYALFVVVLIILEGHGTILNRKYCVTKLLTMVNFAKVLSQIPNLHSSEISQGTW